MAKNTGKPSESIFLDHYAGLGKRAFVHRVLDASDVKGMTGRIGHVPAQPSDFQLTLDGVNYYAEVKSTQHQTSFPFSLLKKTQKSFATRIVAAGGPYLVYAHRLLTNQWYVFPYGLVLSTMDAGKSSISWDALTSYLRKDF